MTHKVPAAMLAMSACLALVSNAFSITAFETTVAEIVKNPDKFNQGEVIVQGKAVQIQQKITQQGSPYTSFTLVDANTAATKSPLSTCRARWTSRSPPSLRSKAISTRSPPRPGLRT